MFKFKKFIFVFILIIILVVFATLGCIGNKISKNSQNSKLNDVVSLPKPNFQLAPMVPNNISDSVSGTTFSLLRIYNYLSKTLYISAHRLKNPYLNQKRNNGFKDDDDLSNYTGSCSGFYKLPPGGNTYIKVSHKYDIKNPTQFGCIRFKISNLDSTINEQVFPNGLSDTNDETKTTCVECLTNNLLAKHNLYPMYVSSIVSIIKNTDSNYSGSFNLEIANGAGTIEIIPIDTINPDSSVNRHLLDHAYKFESNDNKNFPLTVEGNYQHSISAAINGQGLLAESYAADSSNMALIFGTPLKKFEKVSLKNIKFLYTDQSGATVTHTLGPNGYLSGFAIDSSNNTYGSPNHIICTLSGYYSNASVSLKYSGWIPGAPTLDVEKSTYSYSGGGTSLDIKLKAGPGGILSSPMLRNVPIILNVDDDIKQIFTLHSKISEKVSLKSIKFLYTDQSGKTVTHILGPNGYLSGFVTDPSNNTYGSPNQIICTLSGYYVNASVSLKYSGWIPGAPTLDVEKSTYSYSGGGTALDIKLKAGPGGILSSPMLSDVPIILNVGDEIKQFFVLHAKISLVHVSSSIGPLWSHQKKYDYYKKLSLIDVPAYKFGSLSLFQPPFQIECDFNQIKNFNASISPSYSSKFNFYYKLKSLLKPFDLYSKYHFSILYKKPLSPNFSNVQWKDVGNVVNINFSKDIHVEFKSAK